MARKIHLSPEQKELLIKYLEEGRTRSQISLKMDIGIGFLRTYIRRYLRRYDLNHRRSMKVRKIRDLYYKGYTPVEIISMTGYGDWMIRRTLKALGWRPEPRAPKREVNDPPKDWGGPGKWGPKSWAREEKAMELYHNGIPAQEIAASLCMPMKELKQLIKYESGDPGIDPVDPVELSKDAWRSWS